MPTRAERTALFFLSAVVLTGGLVRLVRAARDGAKPTPAAAAALASQQRSVDSAAGSRRGSRGEPPRERRSAPRGGGRSGQSNTGRVSEESAAPTAEPAPVRSNAREGTVKPPDPTFPIDVDRATAKELEALPRVGPTLAARIVAEREANGLFGSLDALDQRVKGIGPALVRAIHQYVTFSGRSEDGESLDTTRTYGLDRP